jgi:hypothetical protein
MKKRALVLCLVVLAAAAVGAQGLYVTPSAALCVGVNNYLRGGEVVGMTVFDIGFLAVGIEAKADYDMTFNIANFPLLAIVGFGRNFWVGVGYTVPVGAPSLISSGSSIQWQLGTFPNTFELGGNVLSIPIGIGNLTIPSTISFTTSSPINTSDPLVVSMGALISALAGLKATVGIGLEFKVF